MTDHDASVREEGATTVRRVERGREAFGAAHQAQLARLIETGTSLYAEAATRRADLARRAYGPIQRMVEGDAAAKGALAELREFRISELARSVRSHGPMRTFDGPGVASLLPSLHRGINVFAPPFDLTVSGPNRGEDEVTTDRFGGTFKVRLASGKGGARWATAGVSMALQAGAAGVAHVRPAWHYDYYAEAWGHWLGSHTEGAGKLVAQDATSGAVLKDVTRPLWSFDDDHSEDDNGYIDSWALAADFVVQANQIFTVSFLATALVDDSGTGYWWSLASASLEMRVPFFVVELGP